MAHARSIAPVPYYSKDVRCAEDAMQALRMRMHTVHPEDLATAIGVTASTIRAIRSGRTKWPRPATFFGLVNYLGMMIVLTERRK